MATRNQFRYSCELATGSQMPIRFQRTSDNSGYLENRQRQPDANMHILVNWQLAARCQFDFRGFKTIIGSQEIGKWQSDANSHIHVNWQVATGSQMPIQF